MHAETANPEGYAHPAYVRSLAEFGEPLALARSGGWLLRRAIPDSSYADAMGAYPIFVCRDWNGLPGDLDELEGLVSVTTVLDPFGSQDREMLSACFPDLMQPFKDHFVADLTRPPEDYVSRHHRRAVRRAFRNVEVARAERPLEWLDDWLRLYGELIERHHIRGIPAFSRRSFAEQFEVPGILAHRAVHQGQTVGMALWYRRGVVASYHLAATSEQGYELECSYALVWYALEDLAKQEVRWAHLGAGAGLATEKRDGLAEFKKGWSTETRTAWLCGRVFDRKVYDEMARQRGVREGDYFPLYRSGEFG